MIKIIDDKIGVKWKPIRYNVFGNDIDRVKAITNPVTKEYAIYLVNDLTSIITLELLKQGGSACKTTRIFVMEGMYMVKFSIEGFGSGRYCLSLSGLGLPKGYKMYFEAPAKVGL